MAVFTYKAIDLEGPAFRLIRLKKGHCDPIECQLFDAWLNLQGNAVDYAALSYAWGGREKPYDIMVNGGRMAVTKNLYLALRHLRYERQDRVLWIDAICIDQANDEERGHQVRQMASIYGIAERVIIWLGEATLNTDLAMHLMKQIEDESIKLTCNSWGASDKRWMSICSAVRTESSSTLMARQREGVESLLGRPWFKRVWVLQEAANARAAEVVCGTKSISARIFALTPHLVGIMPDPHCQAVLDIMPGPSRKSSWWIQARNLQMLLIKFGQSEASDPRDIIYALLSMASDVHDTSFLQPDYGKTMQEVIHDTILFLLGAERSSHPMDCLPDWTLQELLENLQSLSNTILSWAITEEFEVVVELILKIGHVDINSQNNQGRTLLWQAAEKGFEAIIAQLVKRGDVHTNTKDLRGRTVLSWAAENGNKTLVDLLVERDDIDADSNDKDGQTPLSWAARNGHEAVVELLVERDDVDVNSKDTGGQTPLSWAARNGHEAVVELLMERNDVDMDSKDTGGQTPLSWAARNGHEAVVELLMERNDVDMDSKDKGGQTPLSWAAWNGEEVVLKLLVERDDIDADSKDKNGQTPLSWAARNGHEAVVELLVERDDVDVNSKDRVWGQTPLSWAAEQGRQAVIELLIDQDNVDINLKDNEGRTPLSWAAANGHSAAVKLLVERHDVDINLKDNEGQTPLSWAAANGHRKVVKQLRN